MDNEAIVDVRTSINALYMLFCIALLPLVIIGIAFFYSGLTQRRSSLTMFAVPMLVTPLIFIDWFIWGYSFCYSASSNHFIGNLGFSVLRQLETNITMTFTNSRGEILFLNHFLFNGLFKIICAGLAFPGCIAERGRILPMLVFLFFWSIMIYNPVTYWFWNSNGWLSIDLGSLPVLDFAGGNCIHIVSGFTCLAYSYILGPRNPKILYNYRNINTGHIIIGTFCVMCGWVGFIAGCDFKFSYNSLYIIVNTILAALSSTIIWTSIDYFFSSIPLEGAEEKIASIAQQQQQQQQQNEQIDMILSQAGSGNSPIVPVLSETGVLLSQRYHQTKSNFISRRKFSMISFSSGIMTGLVVYTPGGGYVAGPGQFWKAIVFGVVGAIICNLSTRLKYFFKIDDALDIFAIHGIAGIVGSLLTGLFANTQYNSDGGWVVHNWIQFGYQLLGVTITSSYVFIMTCVFLYVIDLIPGLHLRIDKDFNRRERKRKSQETELEAAAGTGVPATVMAFPHTQSQPESQKSPLPEEICFWEQVELLGTDSYEFNGEYMMDFIEFIKVIRPQDYEDENTYDEIDAVVDPMRNRSGTSGNLQTDGAGGNLNTGMFGDYEMHHEGVNHLIKRE
ncbi:uncharacterized protein J8A68_001145 [[Candida] subhashii]|uniref:Ammonium transporter AmtB-like domain-containing protein n=1 Tax=[Candida] subhashii TaxID=561895 RepID=A0A8J5QLU5_9ASCO|nr:uncharacterized protein J8A68_001145 [[Candida] subhashii]KAG7665457.1 hypothetical protein J8A68_001145 [[Candida] subhashii]